MSLSASKHSNTRTNTNAHIERSQAHKEAATFSTRDSVRSDVERAAQADPWWQVRAVCQPGNMCVLVLMLVLMLLSVLLPFREWQRSVDERDGKLAREFEGAVQAHLVGLNEALSSLDDRAAQYEAFLQQIRTFESFRAYAARDNEVGAAKLWLPRVPHAQRAAFEDRVSATYATFFNETGLRFNITDFVLDDGRVTGFVTSPVRSEYYPIDFFGGLDVVPRAAGRDLLTEPVRARALRQAVDTGTSVTTARTFALYDDGPQVSSFFFQPVRQYQNASNTIGVLLIGLRPDLVIVEAVNEISPVSLGVRVFDITGDVLDSTGCLKPLLFDGERLPGDGSWETTTVDRTYCPANPETLVATSERTSVVLIGGRQWMFVFRRGSRFEESQIDTDLVLASGVVAALTVILVCGVLLRGWLMVGSLRASHIREQTASRKTKEFLSFVTHELRNPLFALLGTAGELSLASAEQNFSDDVRELASSIEVSAERMSTIIDDVLNVRKLEEGKLEIDCAPVSPKSVIREVHAMFAPRAKAAGISFNVRVQRAVPNRVLTDAGRLVQVVANFMSNAIKFTAPGGAIDLTVGVAPRPAWLEEQISEAMAQARDNGKIFPEESIPVCLLIEVEDTGVGISVEVMRRLFAPYMQASASTASQHGGTGLGLSICKQLIECMNGEIRVRSVADEGSTFAILLPVLVAPKRRVGITVQSRANRVVHDESNDSLAIMNSSTPSAVSVQHVDSYSRASSNHTSANTHLSINFADDHTPPLTMAMGVGAMELPKSDQPLLSIDGQRVLVVDDQSINRRVIQNLFKRFLPDIHVDTAKNGREAVRAVLDPQKEDYLLVLMDVIMPEMDGRAATAAIRAANNTVPIVAVTGSSDLEELEANEAAGFNETVVKPLRSAALLGLVSKHMRQQVAV